MKEKAPRIAFWILLIVLLAAFIRLVSPFLMAALFAALIAVICHPIDRFFERLFGERRYLAALVTTMLVSICVIVPLCLGVAVIIAKASAAVAYVTTQLEAGQMATRLDELNLYLAQKMSEFANVDPSELNLRADLLELLKSIGGLIYRYSPTVISATASIAGNMILFLIFLFIFFAEGSNIYAALFSLMPLDTEHKSILSDEVRGVISATFLGMIFTALAQGLLIGIGFWIAGINNPILWGFVAVGVTLIPILGAPLMYVSAAISLFVDGATGSAVFLLIYGVCIVSMIDNVIKPLAMRGRVHVSAALLALGLVGGGLWLGASGIIIGPLIVALMFAMIKIYQREFV